MIQVHVFDKPQWDPVPGFDVVQWENGDVRNLIARELPWLLATWDTLQHDGQRRGVARAAVLYVVGGATAEASKPLPAEWLRKAAARLEDSDKTLMVAATSQGLAARVRTRNPNFGRALVADEVQLAKPGAESLLVFLRKTSERPDNVYAGMLGNVVQLQEYSSGVAVESMDGGATGDAAIAVALALAATLLLRGGTFGALTVLTAVTGCIVLVSMAAHGAYVSDNMTCSGPLNDRLFDLIPRLGPGPFSDFLYTFPLAIFIGALVFLLFRDFRMCVAMLVCWLCFFNLRQFTIQLTGVPSPESNQGVHDGFLHAITDAFKRQDTPIRGDYDMIFSGHTGTTVLVMLFMMLYFGAADKAWARALFLVLALASMAGFIAIRIHYSVDVALALVIAMLIFGYGRSFYEGGGRLADSMLFRMLILSQALAFLSLSISLFSTVD